MQRRRKKVIEAVRKYTEFSKQYGSGPPIECPEEPELCHDYPEGCAQGCPRTVYNYRKEQLDPEIMRLMELMTWNKNNLISTGLLTIKEMRMINIIESEISKNYSKLSAGDSFFNRTGDEME